MSKRNPIERSQYINNQYKEYLRSSFEFKTPKLQKLFEQQLEVEDLFKGPYVDLNLPFQRGMSLDEMIADGAVCKSFHRLGDMNFERPLYSHQEESIRHICSGRSAIITTGTGSGKTESFLYPILNELMSDVENGNREVGVRETVAELEKLEVVDDGQGYPSVNHPIFTVQEERTEDNYFCYPVYNSLFYRNCGVKVCNNCYHTKLTPTDQLLYIMECSKGDERLIWKSNRFFEFYIVSYDKCGNATTKKVCNTLEVSSPVCATINSLIKSIITSMSRVHIEEDVRNAIDSYMNGKATASDDNDDFALPFN